MTKGMGGPHYLDGSLSPSATVSGFGLARCSLYLAALGKAVSLIS